MQDLSQKSTLLLSQHLTAVLSQALGKLFKTKRYVIGVSGGIDSVALLDAAVQTLPKESLVVAHFNHRTRGDASNQDETFVRELAEKYAVEFVAERRKLGGLSEATLRKERLDFLKKEAKSRAAYVLLAHHLDDQLETFFFRLIRGCQLKGLMGMQVKNGRLIRPFLHLPKTDLERHIQENALAFRQDSTNFESVYFRNKIRNELLPTVFQLAQEYGGTENFYKKFYHLQKDSQTVLRSLDQDFDRWLDATLVSTEFFHRLELSKLPLEAIQYTHLLRRLLERLDIPFDRKALLRLQSLLPKTSGSQPLQSGWVAEVSCGYLYIQSPSQRKLWEKGISFKVQDRKVICEAISFETSSSQKGWRTFLPGDRLGKKKLKEEFLRRRVPRMERTLIPVLPCGNSNKIIWFLGQNEKADPTVKVRFPFALVPLQNN